MFKVLPLNKVTKLNSVKIYGLSSKRFNTPSTRSQLPFVVRKKGGGFSLCYPSKKSTYFFKEPESCDYFFKYPSKVVWDTRTQFPISQNEFLILRDRRVVNNTSLLDILFTIVVEDLPFDRLVVLHNEYIPQGYVATVIEKSAESNHFSDKFDQLTYEYNRLKKERQIVELINVLESRLNLRIL